MQMDARLLMGIGFGSRNLLVTKSAFDLSIPDRAKVSWATLGTQNTPRISTGSAGVDEGLFVDIDGAAAWAAEVDGGVRA